MRKKGGEGERRGGRETGEKGGRGDISKIELNGQQEEHSKSSALKCHYLPGCINL